MLKLTYTYKWWQCQTQCDVCSSANSYTLKRNLRFAKLVMCFTNKYTILSLYYANTFSMTRSIPAIKLSWSSFFPQEEWMKTPSCSYTTYNKIGNEILKNNVLKSSKLFIPLSSPFWLGYRSWNKQSWNFCLVSDFETRSPRSKSFTYLNQETIENGTCQAYPLSIILTTTTLPEQHKKMHSIPSSFISAGTG